MAMFQRIFGGGNKGQAVSTSSANKTVDAIQKLGEVLLAYAPHGTVVPNTASSATCSDILLIQS